MTLNAVYNEKKKKFVSGILSNASNPNIVKEEGEIVKIYDISDANFIPLKHAWENGTEEMNEYADMINQRTKELDSPVVLVDMANKAFYILNKISTTPNSIDMAYCTLDIDSKPFPNGVDDILALVNI